MTVWFLNKITGAVYEVNEEDGDENKHLVIRRLRADERYIEIEPRETTPVAPLPELDVDIDLDKVIEAVALRVGQSQGDMKKSTYDRNNNGMVDSAESVPLGGIVGLSELLAEKVDHIDGKGLSSNDFTDELKNKLENLPDEHTPSTGGGHEIRDVQVNVHNTRDYPHATAEMHGTSLVFTFDGIKGETGDTGAKGDKGDAFKYEDFTPAQLAALKGEKGDKGDRGERGEEGPHGPKGDKGEPGEDAVAALNPCGDWELMREYHKSDYVHADDGNTYVLTAESSKGDNPASEDHGGVWQLIALRGAQGPKGDIGELEISSVGDNALEMKEDGLYVYANMTQISSDEGNTITLHEDGLYTNARGEPGPTGASAYDIAVAHGFVGSEEEWLYSLTGADGKGGTYEDVIMNTRQSWTVQAEAEGHGKWIPIGQDVALSGDITDFDIIRFEIDPADTASGIQEMDFEVRDIVFNPTEEFRTGGSRLEIIGNWVKDNDTEGSFGAYHTTLSGWFKDAHTFYVDRIGTATIDPHEFRLNKIFGIKELEERGFDVDTALSRTSSNAVENQAITKAIYEKDYFFATNTNDDTVKLSTMTEGYNPLSVWTNIRTNMDNVSKAGYVRLKAGRIYKAQFLCLYGYGSGSLFIRDDANKTWSSRGFISAYTTAYSDVPAVAIIAPEKDMYIRPYMAKPSITSGQTSNANWFRQCSYFTIEQL